MASSRQAAQERPLSRVKRLWAAADELRPNSKLKASEYSVPVLGLIFLRYADFKFGLAERALAGRVSRRRTIGPR